MGLGFVSVVCIIVILPLLHLLVSCVCAKSFMSHISLLLLSSSWRLLSSLNDVRQETPLPPILDAIKENEKE